jgi:2-polyprenyl-6-methoxyphenol hydroxylase-like FAD-dependent oxidoreductase
MANSDALIVGAGPVGMVAAIELARRDIPVRIVDQSELRTKLSKAVGINSQSMELLEASGLTERVLAAGIRIQRANIWFDGSQLLSLDLSLVRHRFNFILALAQSETERILEEALIERGVTVERQVTLTEFEDHGDRISARLKAADGKERDVDARRLLGADGSHSLVRKTLHIPFKGARYDETWSLADITLDWPHGYGEINLFLSAAGPMLFTVPIGPERIRAISQTDNALGMLPTGSRVELVHWQSTFHVALRQAETYQHDNAYLAGDAAHVHSPAGGRGMNLGIWDACSFAERCAAGTLEGYSAERHPIGSRILAVTDRMFRIASLTPGLGQVLRNTIMRTVARLPVVQQRIASQLLGIEG